MRLVAARLGEGRRTAEDLGPVRSQPLDVLRVLAGVRERVVQLGIGEAARVMRPCEREKGGVAAGVLVERRPGQIAFCTLPPFRQRVQTYARVGLPRSRMRTRWRFGLKRRFVATIEWLRL
jgi:hypothetical protein